MPAQGRLPELVDQTRDSNVPTPTTEYMTSECMSTVWHVSEGERGRCLSWEGHGGLLRGTHLVALCMVCRVEVRELEEVKRALGLALAQCGVD